MQDHQSTRYRIGSGARIFDSDGPVEMLGRFVSGQGMRPAQRHAFARKIVEALNLYESLVERGQPRDKA